MSEPQIDPQLVTKIEQLSVEITPKLTEIVRLLRGANLHEFEILVEKTDKFYWSGGLDYKKTPSQGQLEVELMQVLDMAYPGNTLMFMGMVYSPNRNLAQALAQIVAEHRRRDRHEIMSQIFALIAAFQQGS